MWGVPRDSAVPDDVKAAVAEDLEATRLPAKQAPRFIQGSNSDGW
jgi:hypothetical protein